MKHIKLFENKWTENKLKSFISDSDEIRTLIKEFLLIEKYIKYEDEIINFHFENMPDHSECIIIEILIGEKLKNSEKVDHVYLEEPYEMKNLYTFINDPEAYRNSKKYNI